MRFLPTFRSWQEAFSQRCACRVRYACIKSAVPQRQVPQRQVPQRQVPQRQVPQRQVPQW